jgi:succinoglycan biosynthesis transport protein ExoP
VPCQRLQLHGDALVTNRTEEHRGRSSELETALEIWSRRKWVALAVFATILAATTSLTVSLPDLYRATATVLVETQQISETLVQPTVAIELETRLQTIRQEVMSRTRLWNLITQFDLYPSLRKKGVPFDAIIEQMRRDIDLELKGEQQASGRSPTIAFEIGYAGRDPQVVAGVANALASFYVSENSKIREGQAVRTAEFLKAQLADAKSDMDAHERRASEYNVSHIGELPQQVAANLASLERLNTQLRLNGDNQVRAMDRRDRLERQLADAEMAAPATPAAGPAPRPRAEQAASLRRQLEEARGKFTDQYPDVVRLRTELAAAERQLSQRDGSGATATSPATTSAPALDPKTLVLQSIADADRELKALKAEELALHRSLNSYEQRVENGPKRQEEVQALSRDYNTTKERYETLLKRYEEAQLAASLEQGRKVGQFRVLDAAIAPREAAAPSRPRLFAIGLLLAIGLAVAAVLLSERLDTAFHSIEDLRAFVTVPALFSIPLIATAAERRRTWRRLALTTISIVVGLIIIIAGTRALARGNEQIVRLTARGHV